MGFIPICRLCNSDKVKKRLIFYLPVDTTLREGQFTFTYYLCLDCFHEQMSRIYLSYGEDVYKLLLRANKLIEEGNEWEKISGKFIHVNEIEEIRRCINHKIFKIL